jgi:integrative and conjugative element protein (TIGR02256 family)
MSGVQYVSALSTPDRRTFVTFRPDVLRLFAEHRQGAPALAESGGILLGSRRGLHLEVTHATSPYPTDVRTCTSFERRSEGHQDEASARWRESEGTVDHIGEWHTHPELVPSPSSLDTREWAKLLRHRSPPATMLGLIVGTVALYVVLLCPEGQAVELVD